MFIYLNEAFYCSVAQFRFCIAYEQQSTTEGCHPFGKNITKILATYNTSAATVYMSLIFQQYLLRVISPGKTLLQLWLVRTRRSNQNHAREQQRLHLRIKHLQHKQNKFIYFIFTQVHLKKEDYMQAYIAVKKLNEDFNDKRRKRENYLKYVQQKQ